MNQRKSILASYHCEILACVSESDQSFAKMRFSGIHVRDFQGFPPTGKEVHWLGAALFRFEQDKIAEASRQFEAILLRQILAAHCQGTCHGIRRDPVDGLLRAGEPGLQLTWMDAKVNDEVFTPRIGKPVEVNALWCCALHTISAFEALCGDSDAAQRCSALAEEAQRDRKSVV